MQTCQSNLASKMGSLITIHFKRSSPDRGNIFQKVFSQEEGVDCNGRLRSSVETHRPCLKYILFMRWSKLYEIHLPYLQWSTQQFKMSTSSANRLPCVILLTSGAREAGPFCSLINVFSPILIHECYHFVSRPTI